MSQRVIKPTGRQRIWQRLQDGPITDQIETAKELKVKLSSLQGYLSGLRLHGYVSGTERGHVTLIKNTGPEAPAVNLDAGTLHDWNLNPPMTGEELQNIISKSGLTLSGFMKECGQTPNTRRLRAMIAGTLPVSPRIELTAKRLQYPGS